MKKLIFLLFIMCTAFTYGQAVDFDYPDHGDDKYSNSGGAAVVDFRVLRPSEYYLQIGATETRIKKSGDSWPAWENTGPTGTWYLTEEGTYYFEARVWVVFDMGWGSDYWIYSSSLSLSVHDATAPSVPSSFAITTYNNAPKITWSANTELDLDY
jgi:hypothetical protein